MSSPSVHRVALPKGSLSPKMQNACSSTHTHTTCIRPPRQKAVESKKAKGFKVPQLHLMACANHHEARRLPLWFFHFFCVGGSAPHIICLPLVHSILPKRGRSTKDCRALAAKPNSLPCTKTTLSQQYLLQCAKKNKKQDAIHKIPLVQTWILVIQIYICTNIWDIFSDILPDISSDILSDIFLTYLLTFFLTNLLTLFLMTYLSPFFLTYLLTFFLTYLSDISSDISFHILSAISFDNLSVISSCISPGILSDISFDILSVISSDILSVISFDILADISSDMLSDISFVILSNISSGIIFDISFDILCNISFVILSDKSFDILSDTSSDILSDIFLTYLLIFFLTYLLTSDISFWHFVWHFFWHYFWHIFCHFFWQIFWHITWGPARHTELTGSRLRSDTRHWTRMIAVGVRRATLNSQDRSWGPARHTQRAPGWGPTRHTELTSSRLGSGTPHWTHELAIEVRHATLNTRARSWGPTRHTEHTSSKLRSDTDAAEGGRRGGEETDIKSNNPHLTGGEKMGTNSEIFGCIISILFILFRYWIQI